VDAVILDIFKGVNISPLLRNVAVVDNMPARKAGLFEAADALLVLPGGLGTLEEASEVLCWQQLGLHRKPVVLVNTNGFWTGLERWLADITAQGFVSGDPEGRGFYVRDTPEEAIAAIKGHVHRERDLQALYRGFKDTSSVVAAELRAVTSDWDAARRKFEGTPAAPAPGTDSRRSLALALAAGVLVGAAGCWALTRSPPSLRP
jgi:hypothetical protein